MEILERLRIWNQWTLSREVSPVRTSAIQAMDWASRDLAAGYGPSIFASLAFYDPDSCSWKTSQLCLNGDLQEFWEIWPRSGMILNGKCFQLRPLVPRTAESEYGSLPTPMARDQKDLSSQGKMYACQRERHQPSLVTESYLAEAGGPIAETYEWAMGYERGWTDVELLHSETPSSPKSPSTSDG